MYVCVYICVHVCIYVRVGVCVCVCVCVCVTVRCVVYPELESCWVVQILPVQLWLWQRMVENGLQPTGGEGGERGGGGGGDE